MNPFDIHFGAVFLALVCFLFLPLSCLMPPGPAVLLFLHSARVIVPQVQPYLFPVGDSASLEMPVIRGVPAQPDNLLAVL